MRSIFFGFAMLLAACAGAPSTPPAPGATAVAAQPGAQSGPEMTTQKILTMKRLGYTIKNENGQVLFCHEDKPTGTHVRREVTCMTEMELDDLRDTTQQRMGEMMRNQPPPQGK